MSLRGSVDRKVGPDGSPWPSAPWSFYDFSATGGAGCRQRLSQDVFQFFSAFCHVAAGQLFNVVFGIKNDDHVLVIVHRASHTNLRLCPMARSRLTLDTRSHSHGGVHAIDDGLDKPAGEVLECRVVARRDGSGPTWDRRGQ
jgi:hypothetical protein